MHSDGRPILRIRDKNIVKKLSFTLLQHANTGAEAKEDVNKFLGFLPSMLAYAVASSGTLASKPYVKREKRELPGRFLQRKG